MFRIDMPKLSIEAYYRHLDLGNCYCCYDCQQDCLHLDYEPLDRLFTLATQLRTYLTFVHDNAAQLVRLI